MNSSPFQPLALNSACISRVAEFLEKNPGSDGREVSTACGVHCVTQVVFAMTRQGYRIGRAWRVEPVAQGGGHRHVRTYRLIQRPASQSPNIPNQ